jgi:hypothetical protein
LITPNVVEIDRLRVTCFHIVFATDPTEFSCCLCSAAARHEPDPFVATNTV